MNALSRRFVLAGLAALPLAHSAFAQEPALKIVYPYPAGGSGDAIARMIADHLQKSLNRPVVVENKTGAGGRIGVQSVKDAAPDGNTLLFTATGPMTFVPHLLANLGYDPFADFVPISQVATTEIALAVSGQLQVRSLRELAAWLKNNPDSAVYASPGAGTSAHFAGAEFGRAFELVLRHAAYRGAPAALPDILSNRVPILLALTGEMIAQHNSGGVVILATAGSDRSPFLPDVPTFKESGVDIEAPNGFAFYAPAHTPADIVGRFEKEILAAAQVAAVKQKIQSLGLSATASTAADLTRMQRAQFDRWGTAVKASGFKPE
jgi:tripartite-type tricarboxylate transporter receptor subunit TctC